MLKIRLIWFLLNFGVILGLRVPQASSNSTFNTTETLPLFMNITGRYFKSTNFLFITQEIESIENFSLFLKNMPGTVEIHDENEFTGKFGFFIFFPQNTTKSYRNILKNITPFTYNRFLIFWLDDPDESQMHSFVFQFWEFKLMNIAILKKNPNASFDIYTYDPYTESNCNRPGPLDLLDTWNSTHRYFRLNSDLFPLTKKLKNLHGCELVCFAKTRPPDAIVKEVGNNTWELDGIGGQLMEEVRKRINFTPVIQVPKLNVSVDKYGYDISYGYPELITELLNNFTVDLGFGIYSHIIYDNPRVEFATTTVCECYGWAVPAHSGRIIPVWMYYTNEFSFIVWILILLVFSSAVVVFHLMIKIYFVSSPVLQTIDYVFLYVISLHLGISASPKIKFLKIRLWISAIILYSLIISSAYQSSLGSFLTVPWQRENIKSFQEILSADYNIIGVPQGKRILQRFSADNYVLKTLSNYFQVHREHFDSVVLRIHRQKDTATFGAQRFIQFYISNELNGSNRDDIYLLPKCVIQAHASPFLHKKGSPFIKPIDNIISSAVESGLTNFWFKYSTPKISRTLAEIFPLSLQQLKLAFAILVVGNFIAILSFVYEIKQQARST